MAEGDTPAGKGPTKGRVARTAMLGRVAAGGAARWAGDRLDRGTDEERQRRRGDRVVATIDSLVDQLAVMRGAAMKAGQVLSTIEFPGLDEDQAAYLQQRLASLRDNVPAVEWKQMREVLADEWGAEPETRARRDRSRRRPPRRASARCTAAAAHDGTEVAVKVQYPGIAEAVESDMRNLRMLTPVLKPPDAGARDQGRARRARPAGDRGVRLRARGRQPPPHRTASGAGTRSCACPASTRR